MKKTLMLMVACGAVLCGFAAGKKPEKPLRVLMIGNSFSICNLAQMPHVADSMGKKLDLASLFIGGCSIDGHWHNVIAATNSAYRPYRFDRVVNKKVAVNGERRNIPDTLKLEKWDVVTIQQSSHMSWQPETFHPYGDKLVAKIRELAPQAKVFVQETWSYPSWDARYPMFGFDHAEMHRRVQKTYADFAKQHDCGVIPVGTAAEIVPNRDKLFNKPDYHFNLDGMYLQGLTFTAKLFEIDVRKCRYKPAWMSAQRATEMKNAAMKAVGTGRVED